MSEMREKVAGTEEANLRPRPEIAFSLQQILEELPGRGITVTPEQEQACLAIGHALLDGVASGYVEMPTGTGKTVAESLLAEAAVRAGKRVLILAPTKNIANQLHGADGIKSSGLHRFTNLHGQTSVAKNFGGAHARQASRVVVSTYASFINGTARWGEFDVVIADECHRSLGNKTSEAMKAAYPDAFKVGFSATPDYATDRLSEEVYERPLFEFSLINAVESGRTAPIRSMVYTTNDQFLTTSRRRDFTNEEIGPLMYSMERNGTAIELAGAFVQDGRQGIIACIPGEKNYHARILAQMLRENGLRATDIGAHLSDEDVSERLALYNNGTIDVLTFTRSLEEGWDSDHASFAINLAPTTSPVRTTQLMGRIMRPKPDGRESIYVDFVDGQTGTNKKQYTALHALGLEYVDFTRTLGRQTDSSSQGWKAGELVPLGYVSSELREKLVNLQGKLIDEVVVQQVEDPLFRQWETRLAKEGMPAELNPEGISLPDSALQDLGKAYRRYVDEAGFEPQDIRDLAEFVSDNPKVQRAMGNLGLRVPFDIREVELVHPISHEGPIENRQLQGDIRKVLGTLSYREAGVIAKRFGVLGYAGVQLSINDLAHKYGVTRSRIWQIETNAMHKLRHPSRTNFLQPYMSDGKDDPITTDPVRLGSTHEVQATEPILKFLNALHNWSYRSNSLEFDGVTLEAFVEQELKEARYNNIPRNDLLVTFSQLARRERAAHTNLTRGPQSRLYFHALYEQVYDILLG